MRCADNWGISLGFNHDPYFDIASEISAGRFPSNHLVINHDLRVVLHIGQYLAIFAGSFPHVFHMFWLITTPYIVTYPFYPSTMGVKWANDLCCSLHGSVWKQGIPTCHAWEHCLPIIFPTLKINMFLETGILGVFHVFGETDLWEMLRSWWIPYLDIF